jgi:hypothetical protein
LGIVSESLAIAPVEVLAASLGLPSLLGIVSRSLAIAPVEVLAALLGPPSLLGIVSKSLDTCLRVIKGHPLLEICINDG